MFPRRRVRNRGYYRYVRHKAICRGKFLNDHVYLNENAYYEYEGQYAKSKVSRNNRMRQHSRQDKFQEIIEKQQLAEIV